MTRWLDYPTDVLALAAGKSIRRPFTVSGPGRRRSPASTSRASSSRTTSPILGGGAGRPRPDRPPGGRGRRHRPGPRSPALAIGAATHQVVAGRSIVSVAVENTGNVRLKPLVEFTLFDAAGRQISQARCGWTPSTPHTDTTVEVPLAALLPPGAYTVRLTLDDAASGADALAPGIPLVIDALPEATGGPNDTPGLIDVFGGVTDSQVPLFAIAIAAAVLFASALAVLVGVQRRRRNRRTRARIERL